MLNVRAQTRLYIQLGAMRCLSLHRKQPSRLRSNVERRAATEVATTRASAKFCINTEEEIPPAAVVRRDASSHKFDKPVVSTTIGSRARTSAKSCIEAQEA
eukprot:CAMPEP_0177577320 /NCGR_PEP_ID=MMETSP0369-20130122/80577_1 /TAXON_ID=447022 ORGANISM="Scrippsiella hangoei-like, Strain SHHI-4" /NCGR_SAMPLE_ID=MMETSP0369 /ASSEMBLY_ACC=CAM_ASM_000364 /LENGTH=100 /DNA_ID=CAMNT_0019065649 /DNA_START=178 /DNA_END=477 /DNA_ORIENTATION=+